MSKDIMVRAIASGEVMAFAVSNMQMVETARKAHNTSPVATAALGRLLAGGVMMGDMLKNDNDKITLQITGDGPLGGLLVTADTKGNAKGYVNNPAVIVPARADGHLGVGAAIGTGTLSVMKDIGVQDVYNGHVNLYSGEIAEDLTLYFNQSEQTPSSVGLGVLLNKDDGSVRAAGGFILQLLPGATDHTIDILEKNIGNFGQVTDRLLENENPTFMLELLLEGLEMEVTKEKPVQFFCDCSRSKVELAVELLGEVELRNLINEGSPIELKCEFCNSSYVFSLEQLKDISTRTKR